MLQWCSKWQIIQAKWRTSPLKWQFHSVRISTDSSRKLLQFLKLCENWLLGWWIATIILKSWTSLSATKLPKDQMIFIEWKFGFPFFLNNKRNQINRKKKDQWKLICSDSFMPLTWIYSLKKPKSSVEGKSCVQWYSFLRNGNN